MGAIDSDSPNVHIVFDEKGVAVHIEHIREFTEAVGQLDARVLADDYVGLYVPIYYDPQLPVDPRGQIVVNPQSPVGDSYEPGDPPGLRFKEFKDIMEVDGTLPTFVVSYVETIRGLQVWEAGVSVVANNHNGLVLRVTSSQSSLHREPDFEDFDPDGPDNTPFAPHNLTKPEVTSCVGLDNPSEKRQITSLSVTGIYYYRYRKTDRLWWADNHDDRPGDSVLLDEAPEGLPLPAVPDGAFTEDTHYVVSEVLFSTKDDSVGPLPKLANWQALIHVKSGTVLRLRSAESHCFADGSLDVDENRADGGPGAAEATSPATVTSPEPVLGTTHVEVAPAGGPPAAGQGAAVQGGAAAQMGPDDIVSELVTNLRYPPPGAIPYWGYLGRALKRPPGGQAVPAGEENRLEPSNATETYWRLYRSLEVNEYIEFREADVAAFQKLAMSAGSAELEGGIVWLKAGTRIQHIVGDWAEIGAGSTLQPEGSAAGAPAAPAAVGGDTGAEGPATAAGPGPGPGEARILSRARPPGARLLTARGYVFADDPLTKSNRDPFDPPDAVTDAEVQYLRVPVNFEVNAADPVRLDGPWVQIVDLWNPIADPYEDPTDRDGRAPYVFSYRVIAEERQFTAVNAYYHFDSMYRFMSDIGLLEGFFPADAHVPVEVDPLGMGSSVDAKTMGYQDRTRLQSVYYGCVSPGKDWGNALDRRVTLHEFCHGLLWASLHDPNFVFAHSAGDSLGAILCDPRTRLMDDRRFQTFPWMMALNPGKRGRFHGGSERKVDTYAWGGEIDLNDTIQKKTYPGYSREQILSTTLFRAYQALGGDATTRAHNDVPDARVVRLLAAHYMCYLIIRAIGGLPHTKDVPTGTPDAYATALMEADTATTLFNDRSLQWQPTDRPGLPGGTAHKVLRWSYEMQGLYQPPGTGTPVTTPGKPRVDIYIDDTRNGDYLPYLEDFQNTTEIWNRHAPYPIMPLIDADLLGEHQPPISGQPNYLYVRLKNRGQEQAGHISVQAYYSDQNGGELWPHDWTKIESLPANSPAVAAGGAQYAGAITWTPPSAENILVMLSVSAYGDMSNIDPATPFACQAGPTPTWRLVPFDNNVAIREMHPA